MNLFVKKITNETSLSSQEASWLLEYITGKKKEALILVSSLNEQEQAQLQICIAKLNDQHMPLAYILGFVPFLDLRIKVQAPILIPRPETEEWVHSLIQMLQQRNNSQEITDILDIGTGSGCIALALAYHFPRAHVTAVDISPKALELAQHNAHLNKISNVTFIESDLFSALPKDALFDLIVSNPPYIDQNMIETISSQVKNWEDHAALFASNQGMAIIEKILQNADDFLRPSATLPYQLVIEIDQYHKDGALSCAQNYDWTATPQEDSFNNWRTIWCKKT